jgi:hypothetical protein
MAIKCLNWLKKVIKHFWLIYLKIYIKETNSEKIKFSNLSRREEEPFGLTVFRTLEVCCGLKSRLLSLQQAPSLTNYNCGISKMAARGRKQKACLLKWNLGEKLETDLAGKATEKRENFDPSTPPACTEHLHFTLNEETRRAPQAIAICQCPDGLGRHRPQGELSGTQYFHRHPSARSA